MARGECKPIDTLEHAVDAFAEGAMIRYGGVMLKDDAMMQRGLDRATAALNYIDEFNPSGREILVPLLADDDEGVRAFAAGALIDSHEQACIKVFEDLCVDAITEVRGTAVMALAYRDTFKEWRFGTLIRDPRFYKAPPAVTGDRPT